MLWMIAFANTSLGQNNQAELLAVIKSVGKAGEGHEAAASAIRELNKSDATAIPLLLKGFNGATSLQQNWLMGVVNQAATKGELPKQQIEAYFKDKSNDHIGRLVAFELFTASSDALKKQLIPNLIDDPSLPLRHKAIASLIAEAKALKDEDTDAAIVLMKKALANALNVVQLEQTAKMLRAEGVKVNFQKVMGFLNSWQVVGTFDNTESEGFDVAFGPELNPASVDAEARYKNADGDQASWNKTITEDDAGVIDLNKVIGKQKDASAYAFTTFNSPVEGAAQLRLGSPNATKIWLNGELVMSNEIYHNSDSIDKFISDVKLKEGDNQILLKVCQNNQTQDWAQGWQFQMRICGLDSKPILDESLYQASATDKKDSK
jgi:hypothetical protein